MIVLHTLGDALIEVGGKKIRPSSPLLFASLLYLATERGRRVPRAALREMFFPKSDERSGAHSLRQLLYKLRRLGAPLESDATSVLLPRAHVHDDRAHAADAIHAVNYLPDYSPHFSEQFSEWLSHKRGEIAANVRKTLASSIKMNRETLNWTAVEREARLLLELDPFNEVGVFALAEATALSGAKAAAIALLAEYEREIGHSDLRLPASLLRKRIVQSSPESRVQLTLPFIGRAAEVAELRQCINKALAGQPHLYVIGGESGLGKSRMLSEVTALASLEGASVFTIKCQPHYACRPLSLFIELVPSLRDAPGALGVSPHSLASLMALTRICDTRQDWASDPRDDITRSELLITAINDLVDAVAAEQPLLIAIEDAHWADHESLRELIRLIHGSAQRTLMAICTTRTPDSFPYAARTDDRTIICRLKPLRHEALRSLADVMLASAAGVTDDLREWTARTSGGNPLFLQMLCSHYSATGEAFTVPMDVQAAVVRRVQQLTDVQRRVLATCALLGRHATAESLLHATGWSRPCLLDSIQRLEDDGFLLAHRDSVQVGHDLIGNSVLSLMPPFSRQILHGCVARALEHQYDGNQDASVLWDCAAHWQQSGEPAKAADFLIRCASHAIQIGHAAEAIKLLRQAEALAQTRAGKIRVLRESVIATRAARQSTLTKQLAERLVALDSDGLQHSACEAAVLRALWATDFAGNNVANRLRDCVRAVDAPFGHRADSAHLLFGIALETASPHLAREAYSFIKGDLDSAISTSVGRMIPAHYEICFGDARLGLTLLCDLVDSDWQFDNVTDELHAALTACCLYAMLGETDKSIAFANRYVDRCDNLGLHVWRTEFQSMLCMSYCIQEDYDAAERAMSAVDEGVIAQIGSSLVRHIYNRIELALHHGDSGVVVKLLSHTSLANLGDFVRGRAYLLSLALRHQQADPRFQVDDKMLSELESLYERTKTLTCADSLVIAYAEALKRRSMLNRAVKLLHEYTTKARRETGPIPPSLRRLLSTSEVSLGQLNDVRPRMFVASADAGWAAQ